MFGFKKNTPSSDLEARIAKKEADAQQKIRKLQEAAAIRSCEGKPLSQISGSLEESQRGCDTCVVNPSACPENQKIRGGGAERKG